MTDCECVSAGPTELLWVVRWEENWGTRFPRQNNDYLFASEPSRKDAIEFLCSKGWPAKRFPDPVAIFTKPVWPSIKEALAAQTSDISA